MTRNATACLILLAAASLLGAWGRASAAPPDVIDDVIVEGQRESEFFKEAVKSYRAVERNGVTVYCRKERPTGSRIAETRCFTKQQIMESIAYRQQTRDHLQTRPPRPCEGRINCPN